MVYSQLQIQWHDTVNHNGMIVNNNGMIVNYNGIIVN